MKILMHYIWLSCILVFLGNGAVGFAYAAGYNVEPISNGLSLRWLRNEILQKFGEPKAGWSSCEMDYGGFAIHKCYGPDSARVWIHAPGITLSSGIGVGSSKADVARIFGNSYGAASGPYKLDFSYIGDRVSAIKIDWDAPAGGASDQASTSSNQSKPGNSVGNAVEPISNGLSLRWVRNDIRQKFGEPKAGWSSCEMDYGGFAIHKCYGPDSARVWIHAPGITLSSGIGVGSSKADVARIFGNSYGTTSGPYKLDFSYIGDRVSAIKIDWDAPAGGASDQASTSSHRGKPSKPGDSSGLTGTYWCIAPTFSVGGTLNLLPDGTYEMNGAAAGHYKAANKQVRFDGTLKDWNNGVARIDGGTLIFEWQNSDGSKQYFAYRR